MRKLKIHAVRNHLSMFSLSNDLELGKGTGEAGTGQGGVLTQSFCLPALDHILETPGSWIPCPKDLKLTPRAWL